MPESLAVRKAATSTAITRVHEVLDTFAARDYNGELLTAVRHFPAREAQWSDFPAWVHPDLASAYAAKGIRRLYTHQAAAAEAVHAGKNVVIVTPTAELCTSFPPKPSRKTSSPNFTTSTSVSTAASEFLLMTATLLLTPANPFAKKATSS